MVMLQSHLNGEEKNHTRSYTRPILPCLIVRIPPVKTVGVSVSFSKKEIDGSCSVRFLL